MAGWIQACLLQLTVPTGLTGRFVQSRRSSRRLKRLIAYSWRFHWRDEWAGTYELKTVIPPTRSCLHSTNSPQNQIICQTHTKTTAHPLHQREVEHIAHSSTITRSPTNLSNPRVTTTSAQSPISPKHFRVPHPPTSISNRTRTAQTLPSSSKSLPLGLASRIRLVGLMRLTPRIGA